MGRLPNPHGMTLTGYLREQRRQIRQQGSASSFTRSGMNVIDAGQVASDDFDGDLANRDPGTIGWALGSNLAAFGDLIVRPRSIGDDSLSSLVRASFVGKSDGGFAVPVAGIKVASGSLTVPDGFTGALVTVTCNATAKNTDAATDYLYVSSSIIAGGWSEATGGEAYAQAAASGYATASASGAGNFTGLTPGDVVTCAVRVRSAAGWSAQGSNIANMNATILWFR